MTAVETFTNGDQLVEIAPCLAWCFTIGDEWWTVVLDGNPSDEYPWTVYNDDVMWHATTLELCAGYVGEPDDDPADVKAARPMADAISWKVRTYIVGVLIVMLCRAGDEWSSFTRPSNRTRGARHEWKAVAR